MTIQLRGTQSDQLIRKARANVKRSERLTARAKTAMGRWVAVRRDAATMHPQCRRVRAEGRNDSPVPPGIQIWLLAIASVIKDWQTMPRDEIDATMAEVTPLKAAMYIVALHVPSDLRRDVLRALPRLTPYSFHDAAWQIRRAAFNMQPER